MDTSLTENGFSNMTTKYFVRRIIHASVGEKVDPSFVTTVVNGLLPKAVRRDYLLPFKTT